MSNYVWQSTMSYYDYLQTKSFVSDITSSINKTGREVSMDISRQTRAILASNDAIAHENIKVVESLSKDNIQAINDSTMRTTGAINAGFDKLSYGIEEISSGISELNATFHWGFGQVIAVMGHMNDALSELIKIAKTPVQTVAFNHFEIASVVLHK